MRLRAMSLNKTFRGDDCTVTCGYQRRQSLLVSEIEEIDRTPSQRRRQVSFASVIVSLMTVRATQFLDNPGFCEGTDDAACVSFLRGRYYERI
jgi:hypothetical protein